MTKTILWRTDSETFDPGEIMTPRGDHYANTLSKGHHAAEIALRAGMPDGHSLRANAVYTWRDEDWARHTWRIELRKLKKYLYKLEVDSGDILHTADLSYYTEIGEALHRGQSPDAAIQAYATGAHFDPARHIKPRVEVLVRKAKILERFEP
jgi:hypothetical protein